MLKIFTLSGERVSKKIIFDMVCMYSLPKIASCRNGLGKRIGRSVVGLVGLLMIFYVFSTVIATNLLLVDEIMRAGMSSLKGD